MAEKQPKELKKSGYALITGASMGIGRAFAIECAKNNIDLALLSLPDSGLECVVKYIQVNYNVDVKSFEIDLTASGAPRQIYDWTKLERISVKILINNAGLGHLGPFSEYSYEFYEKIIRLNVESVVLLTRLFLPELLQQTNGYILNVGSIASFYPIPFKSVYSGSKTFIYAFSSALRDELRNSSLTVSVLCPGPILTNQDVIARIRKGGFLGKLITMRPQKMAAIALKNLFNHKAVIVPGRLNRCFLLLNHIIPTPIRRRILLKKFNVQEKIEHTKEKKKYETASL